jgi:hypothetical protein
MGGLHGFPYHAHQFVVQRLLNAVELYTGRPTTPDDPNTDPRVEGSDWDTIVALTLSLAGSEEGAQAALQKRAEEEARRILDENWRGVEAVAEALLRYRRLDSTHLSRTLEEANCPRGEPVYEYELNKLADRRVELAHRYNALINEGRQDEARRRGTRPSQV